MNENGGRVYACDSGDRSGVDADLFTEHSTDSESLYPRSQSQILGDSSPELFSCGGEIDRSNVTAFDYENDGVKESPMQTDALDVACGSKLPSQLQQCVKLGQEREHLFG